MMVYLFYMIRNKIVIFYNRKKSNKRLSPASTFNIYSALIGLDSNILKDESSEFKWDKKERKFFIWNDNHTLESAIKYSVKWYFDKLILMIGKDKLNRYIQKLNYGNNNIKTLKISPFEQLELLKKFYNYNLPFSKKDIDIVKKILVISDKDDIKFSAKTGSSVNLGWFIGCLELKNKNYFFVTNIRGVEADGIKAKKITKDILKFLNLI